jgi:prepilin-type N-terminal cleavage/methylation domain-containing protein
MKNTKKNGFTLIELIIVMVILGVMSAIAIPRYLDSIANAEESTEDAVISNIRSGLRQAASDSLYANGRESWPTNPFDVLKEAPAGYSEDGELANEDGEWTFVVDGDGTGLITHQRADNSRYQWAYDAGIQTGDVAVIGSLEQREKSNN